MNFIDKNFIAGFLDEDEADQMFDAIVRSIAEQAEEEDHKISVSNPIVMQKLVYVYRALKYLYKDSEVEVSYILNKPYKSMGSVSVRGDHILIHNKALFLKLISLASNFDVYPKTDGTIQMDFTFHGLAAPIE